MTEQYEETILRTIVKTILLRIIVFILITITVVFIFKKDIETGFEFGTLDIIIELLSYFIYERVWLKISWGMVINSK